MLNSFKVIILIFYSMIVNINELFHAVNKLFWVLFKDHKNLRYKAQIAVTVKFFIIDPKGVKLGLGEGLLSNRLVPNSTTPFEFTFTMKKCDSIHKNNLQILYSNHFNKLDSKIYKYSTHLYFDRNTLIDFKDYDYYIVKK